jgi:hypothetical protein
MHSRHYPKFALMALVVAIHVRGTDMPASAQGAPARAKAILDRVGVTRGLCVVLAAACCALVMSVDGRRRRA